MVPLFSSSTLLYIVGGVERCFIGLDLLGMSLGSAYVESGRKRTTHDYTGVGFIRIVGAGCVAELGAVLVPELGCDCSR